MNILDTSDPQSAKARFNLRTPLNWLLVLGIFSIVAVFDNVLWDGMVAVILCFIFFAFLDKRTIGFVCPHCNKYVETNRPWICGNKDGRHRNDNVDDFPFIYRCEHCKNDTKTYQCHHCDELIFLTQDQSKFGFAKCADKYEEKRSAPPPVLKDEHLAAVEKRKKDIQIKELDVENAKLDITLKGLNKNLEPSPKEKTPFQELDEYYKKSVGSEDAARKWKAAIDEEFKDDPVEREKRHRVVDQWMLNRL